MFCKNESSERVTMKDGNQEITVHRRYPDASDLTGEKPTREFAEVTIPMPWGHVSGKWYGPQNVRPIVALHGWMDNAGTFDTLVPLMPPHLAVLSIDLPGHGLSSRLPDGCFYSAHDYLIVLRILMNQYRWSKISIIGHSMSSIIAFVFAAVFPDKVDMIICLDALKPHQRQMEKSIVSMATRLDEFIKEDERNRTDAEPPSYTYEELIERLYHGSFRSVNRDRCKYLLARNIQKSEKYPEKYFFCRDRRLKYYYYAVASQEMSVAMAKRISAAHLFIKASNSTYFEDKKYYDEVLEVLSKKDNFEYFEAEGMHHLHLNNPEYIADVINEFIERNGPKPDEKNASKL